MIGRGWFELGVSIRSAEGVVDQEGSIEIIKGFNP